MNLLQPVKTTLQVLTAALTGIFLAAPVALGADTRPEIIDPPLTQFAWVGRPVTFKVTFTNKTAMTFQWQWNGADLSDATNKTYHFASAQPTNNGDYRMILSNSAGIVTSAVARLTVRDWPPPTGVSFTNLASVETTVRNIMTQHAIPAASLAIMKDARLILARGYGYAVPETGEQVQPDSLFRIASLTKAITATAVLRMVDESGLNLDDKVFPILNLPPPTFPGAKLDPRLAKITVRHLLNHTAGWNYDTARNPEGGIGFDPQYWFVRCAQDLGITNSLSIRDLAGWITGFPLQTEPGTTWAYSNNGYILLGALIEQMTGRRYEEEVKLLLAQVDVTRAREATYIRAERPPDEVVQWLSPIYDIRSSWVRAQMPSSLTAELAYHYPRKSWPSAGGMAISPIDYARFVDAIDGRASPPDILSSNAVKTMLTPTAASRNAVGTYGPYGMGWYLDSSNGEIWHPGGLPDSASSIVVRRPDGVTYVAFCSSYDDSVVDDLRATLDSVISAIKTWPTNDLFNATMSYEAWQARHFTADELAKPEISGDDADPDGDGISNLIEYAQGLDPRVADHESWLGGRFAGEGNQLQFALEYRRRPLGHAVAYDVEVSDDLQTWRSWDAPTTTENLDPDGFVAVRLIDEQSGVRAGSRFYRVKVRLSHPKH